MSKPDSPKKITLHRLRKRKEWRKRAMDAATQLFTWQTGMEGREALQRELSKCVMKVQQWSRRHRLIIAAIQRRAVAAFRQGAAA